MNRQSTKKNRQIVRPGTKRTIVMKEQDYTQKQGVMSNLNRSQNFPGPRNLIMSQPFFIAKAQVRYSYAQSITSFGGLYPYLNKKFVNSLYQPITSTVPQWAGLSTLSDNYTGYICPRAKVKLTVTNTMGVPINVTLCPGYSLPSDGQTSLQKYYVLPQAKKLVLAPMDSGKCVGTLKLTVDSSTLFGYDVTSVNSSNFIAAFGSNPSFESGAIMVAHTLDFTSSIFFSYIIEVELDVVLLQAKNRF